MLKGALDKVLVLDASQMLSGPQAAMRLGDLGADVLKIEPPHGEWSRSHTIADSYVEGETPLILGLNRNKRSVVINLKDEDGLHTFYDLVKIADVVIMNYRLGVADRLKVDYLTLSAINPHIVYCSISGYGEDGPYAQRPGQDLVLQGYSGALYSSGSKNDPPRPSPIYMADVMTAYQATIGILGALLARESTERGQKVEINMWATMLDAQQQELSTYLNLGKVPPRTEEPLANAWINAPYGIYKTKDSYIALAMAPLHILGEVLDSDRLREMTNWADGAFYRDEVYRIAEQILPERTTAEWIAIMDQHNIWAGPIYSYEDLENDPHVIATDMIVTVDHPKVNNLRMPNVPIKLSDTPLSIRQHPPLLGEHTYEVLDEMLGYNTEKIEHLRERGAIGYDVPEPTY